MSATPILDAIRVLRFAVAGALDPLTTAGVYWQQADQDAALPYVIFQSQDGGGGAVKRIGDHSWSGLVTVKAFASSQSAAETLYSAVAPGMDTLAYVGRDLTAEFDRPVTIPPLDDVWQSAGIWRVTIN